MDWDWLKGQQFVDLMGHVKVVKLKEPLTVKVDGREGVGIIFRTE